MAITDLLERNSKLYGEEVALVAAIVFTGGCLEIGIRFGSLIDGA